MFSEEQIAFMNELVREEVKKMNSVVVVGAGGAGGGAGGSSKKKRLFSQTNMDEVQTNELSSSSSSDSSVPTTLFSQVYRTFESQSEKYSNGLVGVDSDDVNKYFKYLIGSLVICGFVDSYDAWMYRFIDNVRRDTAFRHINQMELCQMKNLTVLLGLAGDVDMSGRRSMFERVKSVLLKRSSYELALGLAHKLARGDELVFDGEIVNLVDPNKKRGKKNGDAPDAPDASDDGPKVKKNTKKKTTIKKKKTTTFDSDEEDSDEESEKSEKSEKSENEGESEDDDGNIFHPISPFASKGLFIGGSKGLLFGGGKGKMMSVESESESESESNEKKVDEDESEEEDAAEAEAEDGEGGAAATHGKGMGKGPWWEEMLKMSSGAGAGAGASGAEDEDLTQLQSSTQITRIEIPMLTRADSPVPAPVNLAQRLLMRKKTSAASAASGPSASSSTSTSTKLAVLGEETYESDGSTHYYFEPVDMNRHMPVFISKTNARVQHIEWLKKYRLSPTLENRYDSYFRSNGQDSTLTGYYHRLFGKMPMNGLDVSALDSMDPSDVDSLVRSHMRNLLKKYPLTVIRDTLLG